MIDRVRDSLRVFAIRLPSGARYWTLLDEQLVPVAEVDEFLRHLRFGRDAAESTTYTYAGAVGLFLRWCASTGRDWRAAAGHMGMFLLWLRHSTGREDSVVPGPGAAPVRGSRRINTVLSAVREFLKYQVSVGALTPTVLSQLYEVVDERCMPVELTNGGSGGLRYYAKARHRVSDPEQPVTRASDQEVLALLRACQSARDRFIVLLLGRAGLRRSEAVGLRREDLHLMPDSSMLRCPVEGAHLHVVRRDNPNQAWAKSRRAGVVPVDFMLVQAYDAYAAERDECVEAAASDFVLVNLFADPVGRPMRPGAINELFARLSKRADLDRVVHPHSLRHAFGSSAIEAGATLDEVQELLRHASITSTQVYLHPGSNRLRQAVERVDLGRSGSDGNEARR